MVRAYRVLGHFLAILDPLRLDLTSFNKIKAVGFFHDDARASTWY